MKINDSDKLKELRKDPIKSNRRHSYEHKNVLFNQYYDHSTDIRNPYHVNLYVNGDYAHGASGVTIVASISSCPFVFLR